MSKYNLSTLKQNIFNYFYVESVNDNHIQNLINTNLLNQNDDSNILWTDLNELENTKQTPYHLSSSYSRLYEIACGYRCRNSKYYNDESIFNLIKKSLNILSKYFNKDTKIVGNWYEWRIGIPYNYSLICLTINYIDDNYKSSLDRFVRKYINGVNDITYANLASVCKNLYIYGALIDNDDCVDESLKLSIPAYKSKSKIQIKLARYLQNLFIQCKWLPYSVSLFSGKEGIYDDYSFLQHTSIPYIGTYGIEIIQFMGLVYKTNKNTNIVISNEIEKELPKWINSYKYSTYNDEMMTMYCGRSINDCDVKGTVVQIDKYIKEIKGDNDWRIKNNFSFLQPNTDKVIYQHDGWRVGISMCSDRCAKYENFNNQNPYGWYQNLGMFYLYTPYNTYEKYTSKVSPYYLPGVTCNNKQRNVYDSTQPRFNYTKDDLKLLRSGGCRMDDNHISAMMQVNDENVFGRKSWFMYDDYIVCLGSNLKGDNLYTTICNTPNRTYTYENSNKVLVENFGTIITKQDNIQVKDNSIFYINHSKSNNYEYSIVPLKWVDRDYPYNNTTTYCDDNIHILYNFIDNVYMINFFDKGEIEIGDLYVKTDNMVSLILKKESNNIIIYLNDITQSKSKINITLKGLYYREDCSVKHLKINNDNYTSVSVNTKNLFGKTQKILINKI